MADTSWLNNRLSHPDYNNWVKGNLFLQELKTGLVPFLDEKAKVLQQHVLSHVAAPGTVCTVCTEGDLRKKKYICPSAGICNTILQDINTEYTHHPPGTVKLLNTDSKAWCDTARYWEIAKAYISTPGYASKTSAAETDCVGLLTIVINCKWIQKFLSVNPDVFQQVKVLRNEIMHSEKNTLAADQLDKLYDKCIQILQDRHCLVVDSTAQAALARITEIKKKTLSISDVNLPALLFIVDELKAEDDTCREAIRQLEPQSAALETRSSSLETSSQNLKVWLEELKKQQAELDTTVSQLDKRVSSLEDRNTTDSILMTGEFHELKPSPWFKMKEVPQMFVPLEMREDLERWMALSSTERKKKMPRNYVDNSSNRSLWRVGMSVGSMPVSRSSAGSSGYSFSSASASPKTYVDNSYNRNVGRVGMEHVTMVQSRNSAEPSYDRSASSLSSSSSTDKTYVDNSFNRNLGRVGMEHGTMVQSRNSAESGQCSSSASASPKTYVDNSYNRSVGHVGMEHGTMVQSRNSAGSGQRNQSTRPKTPKSSNSCGSTSSSYAKPSENVYVDNYLNRREGRVGKPLGSMKISKKNISRSTDDMKKAYDRYMHQFLEDVPEYKPYSNPSPPTLYDPQFDYNRGDGNDRQESYSRKDTEDTDKLGYVCDAAEELINRLKRVVIWQEESQTKQQPMTGKNIIQKYRGATIEFSQLELQDKIGHGGVGDVYFSKWQGSVVAVKKLRVQRVSRKRLQQFTAEINVFCTLDHPAILKFIGACVVTPNLAIVMEYMQMSLFEAIHMKDDVEFSDDNRKSIIVQIASGMVYLHEKDIAHCDLKSNNVMLNVIEDEEKKKEMEVVAKITDFGLSIMKTNTETSMSSADFVSNIGTPRYSAPEVLRGERLNQKDMKMADVYSLSLVVYEILWEEEPFYNLNFPQLQKHVGQGETTPEMSEAMKINADLLDLLKACWMRNPKGRPTAAKFWSLCESVEEVCT